MGSGWPVQHPDWQNKRLYTPLKVLVVNERHNLPVL